MEHLISGLILGLVLGVIAGRILQHRLANDVSWRERYYQANDKWGMWRSDATELHRRGQDLLNAIDKQFELDPLGHIAVARAQFAVVIRNVEKRLDKET